MTLLAAGLNHVLAATSPAGASASSHTLYAWGSNSRGQLAQLLSVPTVFADSAAAVTLVRGSDGAMLDLELVSLAAGKEHSVAVTRDGRVFAWGDGSFGQLGVDRAGVVDSAEDDHGGPGAGRGSGAAGAGDHAEATVDTAGAERPSAAKKPRVEVQLAKARDTPGSRARSSVWCEHEPQAVVVVAEHMAPAPSIAVGTEPRRDTAHITQAAAGWAHTALLDSHGRLFTTGWGRHGQLGLGITDNVATPHHVSALRSTGGVNPRTGEHRGLRHVSCGAWHTAAACYIGDVYTWGWAQAGQLGHGYGDSDDDAAARACASVEAEPRRVDALGDADVVAVGCGTKHTVAVTSGGEVYVWGSGAALCDITAPTGAVDHVVAPRPRVWRRIVGDSAAEDSCRGAGARAGASAAAGAGAGAAVSGANVTAPPQKRESRALVACGPTHTVLGVAEP